MNKRSISNAGTGAAFTVTELLVVIAVLLVLLALLVPAISRTRDRAHTATCTSNLRQLGALVSLYVSENNGKMPYSILPAEGTGSWVWYSFHHGTYGSPSPVAGENIGGPLPRMAGYHTGGSMTRENYEIPGAKHIFNCPSNKRDSNPFGYVGYVPNVHLMPCKNDEPVYAARVGNPSQVILMTDNNADGPEPDLNLWNFNRWNWESKIGFHRHNGKANALFLDGSVSSLTRDDIDPVVNILPQGL